MTRENIVTDGAAIAHVLIAQAQLRAQSAGSDSAQPYFYRAIQADDTCRARHAYGSFLWQNKRYAAAAEQFSRILEVGEEQGDDSLLWIAAHNLASIYREWGVLEAAARFEQCALRIEVRGCVGGSYPLPAGTLGRSAHEAILAGDDRSAEQLLWHSMLQEMGAGSLEGEASAWGNLGVLAHLQGDLRTGVEYFSRALNLHRRLRDHGGIGRDFLHLGQLVARLGWWPLARRILAQSIRHLRRAERFELAQAAAGIRAQIERQSAVDPARN